MSTERERILKLLEAKKITADEAARLLDVLGDEDQPRRAKFLRVRVYEKDSGRVKVNVTLPVALIRWGMQFVPESAQTKLNERQISFDEISRALDNDFCGKLIDVEHDEKGERVEVYLE